MPVWTNEPHGHKYRLGRKLVGWVSRPKRADRGAFVGTSLRGFGWGAAHGVQSIEGRCLKLREAKRFVERAYLKLLEESK